MGEQAAGDLVRAYWERVWANGDLGAVDDLFAEPYVRHNRSGNARLTRAQLKADMVQYWRTLQNPRPEIHQLTVDGDHVWSRVTVQGIAEDQDVVVSFLQLFRIADGRLAEAWTLTAPEVDWSDAPETHR